MEEIVESRLACLRRLVDGPEASDEAAFVPSAPEELRRRFSACVRLAARHRLGRVSAPDGCSEVVPFLKCMFEEREKLSCGALLDHLGAICGSWLDYEELVEVVDAIGADGSVTFVAVKNYVLHTAPEHVVEVAARVRRGLLEDQDEAAFSRLADKRSSVLSARKLHSWVVQHLELDLTKSEVVAVLRTFNEAAGVAENGADVDKAAFTQFLRTEGLMKRLLRRLATPTAPVVDVRVSVSRAEEDDLRAQGYEAVLDPIKHSCDDDDDDDDDARHPPCDLLRGGGGGGTAANVLNVGRHRACVWYLRKRGTRLRPVIDVRLESSRTNSALAVVGYTCVDKNLSSGVLRGARYLWIARSRGPLAVHGDRDLVDLKVTVGRAAVVDDPIHLPPDGSYVRVEGNVGGFGRSKYRDIFLWVQPREKRAATDVVPAAYAQWSPHRRRLECEVSCRHAVRTHAPPTPTGAPDLGGLFCRHTASGKLGKREFAKLLRDVGFNLEPADRDVLMSRLAVSSRAERVWIDLEDFRTCFALAERDLDEVAADLKRRIRHNNKTNAIRLVLDAVTANGSANLTLAELGSALRHVGHFLTQAELSRLAKRWSTSALDGEVDADAFLKFLEARSGDDDADNDDIARRSAARVQLAADAFRSYVLDAPKHFAQTYVRLSRTTHQRARPSPDEAQPPSAAETAWVALTQLRAQRLRRFAGVPLVMTMMGKKNSHRVGGDDRTATESLSLSTSAFLEADDLALALERQLQFAGVDRLAPVEYGMLVAVIATEGDRIDARSLAEFAEQPFRPIAELLRVLDHRVLRLGGDLLALYRDTARGEDVLGSLAQYRACLFDTLAQLGLVDDGGFPKRMSVDRLRREIVRAARHDEDDGVVARISLAEWCSLAQHAAADAERHPKHRVDAKAFVEGLCRLLAGDEAGGLLPILKPGAKNERRLGVACRDLARRIQRRDQHQDYGDWLRRELAAHDLPQSLPAPANVFQQLLQCFNQRHGWGLDAPHLEVLTRYFGDHHVGANDIEAFFEKHKKRYPEQQQQQQQQQDRRYAIRDDDEVDLNVARRDPATLERQFERRDPQGTGAVSRKDFLRVVAGLGVEHRVDDFVRLDGRIDYRAFCREIWWGDHHVSPEPREDIDDDRFDRRAELRRSARAISTKLRQQQQNGLDLVLPFKINDLADSGCVSLQEFRDALNRLDLGISQAHVDEFAEVFAVPGRPEVSYERFLKFLKDAVADPEDTINSAFSRPPSYLDPYSVWPQQPTMMMMPPPPQPPPPLPLWGAWPSEAPGRFVHDHSTGLGMVMIPKRSSPARPDYGCGGVAKSDAHPSTRWRDSVPANVVAPKPRPRWHDEPATTTTAAAAHSRLGDAVDHRRATPAAAATAAVKKGPTLEGAPRAPPDAADDAGIEDDEIAEAGVPPHSSSH